MTTTEVDNWPADVHGVQGPELMQRFLEHAESFWSMRRASRRRPPGARVITVAHKVWQGLSKGCAKEPSETATQLLRLTRRRDTVIASTET